MSSHNPRRPTVDKVLPLANAIITRDGGGVGCCLYMVFGGNVKDYHVEYCAELAAERNHDDCFEVACLLLKMSRTQRSKLGRNIKYNQEK